MKSRCPSTMQIIITSSMKQTFTLMQLRGADISKIPAKPPNPMPLQQEPEGLRIPWHSNRHAPRNTKERKVRSKIRWFTEFCNSHYLSHFAAFFIDARAKRSVAESCISNVSIHKRHSKLIHRFVKHTKTSCSQKAQGPHSHHLSCEKCTEVRRKRERRAHAKEASNNLTRLELNNDPSAGSPTETLLRLLLPLNDQVWSSSHQQGAVSGSPKPIPRPH